MFCAPQATAAGTGAPSADSSGSFASATPGGGSACPATPTSVGYYPATGSPTISSSTPGLPSQAQSTIGHMQVSMQTRNPVGETLILQNSATALHRRVCPTSLAGQIRLGVGAVNTPPEQRSMSSPKGESLLPPNSPTLTSTTASVEPQSAAG